MPYSTIIVSISVPILGKAWDTHVQGIILPIQSCDLPLSFKSVEINVPSFVKSLGLMTCA